MTMTFVGSDADPSKPDAARYRLPDVGAEATSAASRLISSDRVALVHDYLNQRGGAERVVLEMSRVWPKAPIYTSLYRPDSTFPGFRRHEVRTSYLDKLPVDHGFRNLFPLYPSAFASFGEIDADLVLVSSSGWAHLARVSERALHVVYCHNPPRWLYGREHLAGSSVSSLQAAAAKTISVPMRRADARSARRASLYIANSANVSRRIWEAYGFFAPVIPPPVEVQRFRATPRGDRLLVISRLLPYKRIDLIVRAATRLGIGLDVVGQGPMMETLKALAGPNVTFHGGVSDPGLVQLIEGCRAVCVPGEEDFGIVSVEAQAAGKPVIAYGYGGARESVIENVTGVFFDEPTEESLIAAIRRCEELLTPPAVIAAQAGRFSAAAFMVRLIQLLESRVYVRRLRANEA